jgi:hypothetical protein
MNYSELTASVPPATTPPMREMHEMLWSGRRAVCAGLLLVAGLPAVSGCITVAAPDKPIVIELNINIKQEVVYRLAADAANTIDENKDIF